MSEHPDESYRLGTRDFSAVNHSGNLASPHTSVSSAGAGHAIDSLADASRWRRKAGRTPNPGTRRHWVTHFHKRLQNFSEHRMGSSLLHLERSHATSSPLIALTPSPMRPPCYKAPDSREQYRVQCPHAFQHEVPVFFSATRFIRTDSTCSSAVRTLR